MRLGCQRADLYISYRRLLLTREDLLDTRAAVRTASLREGMAADEGAVAIAVAIVER